MSVKAEIVAQDVVIEQVKGLTEQKEKLLLQIAQLKHRQELVEKSLVENGHLAERVKALLSESLSLFSEEWTRKTEYYPDLWLASLEKAVALNAEKPKK